MNYRKANTYSERQFKEYNLYLKEEIYINEYKLHLKEDKLQLKEYIFTLIEQTYRRKTKEDILYLTNKI